MCLVLNSQQLFHSQTTKEKQPTKEQIEAFRSAKTVRILVQQSYSEAKNVSLPFDGMINNYLKFTELQVIGADNNNYDLEIKMEVSGNAISRKYLGVRYYTGALIVVVISFEKPDVPIYVRSFSFTLNPPNAVKFVYPVEEDEKRKRTPSGAPYFKLFNIMGFDQYIVEMIGDIYGLNCIVAAMKDGNAEVRKWTVLALLEMSDPRAVEPLIAALNHENWEVRKESIKILLRIGDLRAVEPLIAALKDKDNTVRERSAMALGKIRDLRAVEPLIAVLNDEDETNRVRGFSAGALGSIRDPRAIESLIAALSDNTVESDAYLLQRQEMASQALMKITRASMSGAFGNRNQKKWQRWWKRNKKKFLEKK